MKMSGASVTAAAPDSLLWGRIRRIVFFIWAAILSLLSGITFVSVTILTIGLWLAHRNPHTTPVTDLGFFALGAIIIATGFVVQLRAPERKIAGVQQAAIGILALGVAGLIGRRVEPLAGSIVLLAATALLVALHPARQDFFRMSTHLSRPLAALSILAAITAGVYAATMLVAAREAGPSCFFGRCAYGDRFAEMAVLAIAISAIGLLAASRPQGWRITAWSIGVSAIILGGVSILLPDLPASLGRIGGALAVAWGGALVAVAEHESRSPTSPPDAEPRGSP